MKRGLGAALPNKQSAKGATFALLATFASSSFLIEGLKTVESLPRRKSYPARSYKAVLRHALAKHDPNAERREVSPGWVIGHSAGAQQFTTKR